MAFVFQYGSNMSNGEINSPDRLRRDAKALGLVCTKGTFELDFDIWSQNRQCWASDIREGKGRTIWGVLYEVPDYLIKRETARARGRRALDAIEGEGQNYRRREIAVRWRNGKPVKSKVITYTVISPRETGATSLDYARHILKGLEKHNPPKGYVEYLKERIRRSNPAIAKAIARL